LSLIVRKIPLSGGGRGVRWGAIYKRSVKIAAASRTGIYSLVLLTLGMSVLGDSRRKAGLVLLQFWHGHLGSSGGFRRKPIHSKCAGASSRELRFDSGWVTAYGGSQAIR